MGEAEFETTSRARASLARVGGTECRFVVDLCDEAGDPLPGRTYSTFWEPRETDVFFQLESRVFDGPLREPIDDADWQGVLDALWKRRHDAGGFDALLEWVPEADGYLVRRWSYAPDRRLLRIEARHLDVYELGRTLRILAPEGRASWDVFHATRERAFWLLPDLRPPTDEEWASIAATLRTPDPDDRLRRYWYGRLVVD